MDLENYTKGVLGWANAHAPGSICIGIGWLYWVVLYFVGLLVGIGA